MVKREQERNTGIELIRLILMFGIVAGHMLVHGGGIENYHTTGNRLFVSIISPWGLIGYDGFLSISFYYLQDSSFKTKRFIKLFLQVLFYSVLMALISYLLNAQVFYNGAQAVAIESLSIKHLIAAFFPVSGSSHPYASIYILFYLTLPFLQKVSRSITRKQNLYLIVLLFYFEFIIRIIQSIIGYSGTVSATSYGSFVLVYFIVVYLKKYKNNIIKNTNLWWMIFAIAYFIQVIMRLLHYYHNDNKIVKLISSYYFWGGSWAPLNILSGISLLCIGLSLKFDNKVINWMAKGTFAVLLIHDNNYFRYIIYSKVLGIQSILPRMNTFYLILTTIALSLCVFLFSIVVDYIRRTFLEKRLLKFSVLNTFCNRIDMVVEDKK